MRSSSKSLHAVSAAGKLMLSLDLAVDPSPNTPPIATPPFVKVDLEWSTPVFPDMRSSATSLPSRPQRRHGSWVSASAADGTAGIASSVLAAALGTFCNAWTKISMVILPFILRFLSEVMTNGCDRCTQRWRLLRVCHTPQRSRCGHPGRHGAY